ncbi:MAG: type II toxin-antitoxin system VapC family toxin [Anaerolineae bacterium]|jgi:predicted nucleic acid-binding protein
MSNSWVCIDASLVIRLVADPSDKPVRDLWAGWNADRQPLAAPTLLYYEVTNGLYRYQKLGLMSGSSVQSALQAALALPIKLYGDLVLHERARRMADRFSLSATYDAHYLALAQWLGGELWTADGRLARGVQPALAWVHLVD